MHATGRILDGAPGLVARLERDLRHHPAGIEIGDEDLVAIGIGGEGSVAVREHAQGSSADRGRRAVGLRDGAQVDEAGGTVGLGEVGVRAPSGVDAGHTAEGAAAETQGEEHGRALR